MTTTPVVDPRGRPAQRRRTRKAIVDATVGLLAASDQPPSIAEIAHAADVSRRTIYAYFPTLEQLFIDATLGLLSERHVDAALEATRSGDARQRVDAMVRALADDAADTMDLGRRLVKLTIETPPNNAGSSPAKRGYRRIGWIEKALEPLHDELSRDGFGQLVSGLAMVIGWEAMIVLRDICGLNDQQTRAVSTWAAHALIDAALAAGTDKPETSTKKRRPNPADDR